MHLELTDEQTEALIRELSHTINGDRYPLSPRIVALKEILGMLRPEPAPRHRCPRDGITSRRARGGIRGVRGPSKKTRPRLGRCGGCLAQLQPIQPRGWLSVRRFGLGPKSFRSVPRRANTRLQTGTILGVRYCGCMFGMGTRCLSTGQLC